MTKRELRQILASGGLSLIATPKPKKRAGLQEAGSRRDSQQIHGIRIGDDDARGVSVIETAVGVQTKRA